MQKIQNDLCLTELSADETNLISGGLTVRNGTDRNGPVFVDGKLVKRRRG